MSVEYREVLWVWLSEVNGTALGRQFIDYARFFWEMTKKTKCCIRWRIGIEDGNNSHGHFIVSVPVEQLEHFWRRLPKFKHHRAWKFRKMSLKRWEEGHDTYGYTTEKHTDYGNRFECAGVGECRKGGFCKHSISEM